MMLYLDLRFVIFAEKESFVNLLSSLLTGHNFTYKPPKKWGVTHVAVVRWKLGRKSSQFYKLYEKKFNWSHTYTYFSNPVLNLGHRLRRRFPSLMALLFSRWVVLSQLPLRWRTSTPPWLAVEEWYRILIFSQPFLQIIPWAISLPVLTLPPRIIPSQRNLIPHMFYTQSVQFTQSLITW